MGRLVFLLIFAVSLHAQTRVNAGGAEFTDGGGAVWGASNGFSGETAFGDTGLSIDDTSDDTLYATGVKATSSFSYSATVSSGLYRVRLLFAELESSPANTRSFNVVINSRTYLSNLDVTARAGAVLTAYERDVVIPVAGTSIAMTFSRVSGDPFVNAIEITRINAFSSGDTLPDNCDEGEYFWETDDDEFHVCSAADTWTTIGSGVGATVAPSEMADADFGDWTCNTGVCTLDADVVSTAEMADGDHGDFTYSGGTATLDADVVSTAEMADADHGDFSYSGGTATLDADVVAPAEMADADHGDFSYSGGTATLDADVVSTAEMADADHGDFSYSGGTATLDADVVAPAEMADADHGDFTYSGGSATLDANVVDSAEIATDAVGADEIDGSASETVTGDWDFGGGTLQVPNSTSLPGTCEVGDSYMDTDATSGSRWYLCESANTWAAQGGGSGTSINVEENNSEVVSAANLTGIDFLGSDFDVTDDTNEADVAIASALTRDAEWDTAAEINTATTDDDFVTLTGAQTITGDKTFGTASANFLTAEGATADAFETVFAVVDPTADRTITFPNATGTVPLLDDTATLTNKTISGDSNTLSANTHATDCTSETGAAAGQMCHELDDDTFWVYDGSAWDQIGAGGGFQGILMAFDPRRDGMLLDDTTGNETCVLDLEKHTTGAPDIYKWHCAFNDNDNIQFSGVTPSGSWTTITARVGWHDDDTSCDVDWAVSVWSADDGDTATGGSFDTANTIDDAASPGANQIDYAEVTVSNDDTLGAEEGFVVNISFIDDAGSSCSDNADFADTIKLDYFALIFE